MVRSSTADMHKWAAQCIHQNEVGNSTPQADILRLQLLQPLHTVVLQAADCGAPR
jgi:hypothetical protein